MMYMGGRSNFILNKRRSRTRRMVGEIIRALALVVLGFMLAWMALCAPEAGAAELPEIVLNGEGKAGVAKVCFEDVSDRPGPPAVPVCFGPDQWGMVDAPDYPETAVTIYLDIDQPCVITEFGKAGLDLAIFSLRVAAGVETGR